MQHDTRRLFLKRLSAAIGVTAASALLGGSGMASALAYDVRVASEKKPGKLFSQPQMLQLKFIADAILPRTNTPSASELDCHGFIDNQLFVCHSKKEQKLVLSILNTIDIKTQEKYQLSYVTANAKQQQDILNAIEQENGFTDANKAEFKLLKSLIVFGYFTSQIGASKVLRYQAVPGAYKGSVKIDSNTRAWGSLAYY